MEFGFRGERFRGRKSIVRTSFLFFSFPSSILEVGRNRAGMWRINLKPIYHSAKVVSCAMPARKAEEGAGDQFEYYKRHEAESNLVLYPATKGSVTAVC